MTTGPHAQEEEPLPGGNMGGAVRVGSSVRRPAGPWSPTVQRLLRHLHDHGVAWVPEPLGTDDRGRAVVSFLPGTVPQYPLPAWVWADDVLVSAGRLLGELHRATKSFDMTGATWRMPAHEPPEVVCHNDMAPYNMVFADRRLTGLIDWDTASPGPRVWDLAYLAYRLVPLTAPGDDVVPGPPLHERARRLRRLGDAHGHGLSPDDVLPVAVDRLHDLATSTEARARDGQESLDGHADLYRRDARWIGANTRELLRTGTGTGTG